MMRASFLLSMVGCTSTILVWTRFLRCQVLSVKMVCSGQRQCTKPVMAHCFALYSKESCSCKGRIKRVRGARASIACRFGVGFWYLEFGCKKGKDVALHTSRCQIVMRKQNSWNLSGVCSYYENSAFVLSCAYGGTSIQAVVAACRATSRCRCWTKFEWEQLLAGVVSFW